MRIDIDDACSAARDIAADANDRLLFVVMGGELTAYDLVSMDYASEKEVEQRGRTVLGLSGDGGTLLLSWQDNVFFALDAASGDIRWLGQCPHTAGPEEFVPVGEEVILVCSTNLASDGSSVNPTISLRAIDTGTPIWSFVGEEAICSCYLAGSRHGFRRAIADGWTDVEYRSLLPPLVPTILCKAALKASGSQGAGNRAESRTDWPIAQAHDRLVWV